MSREQASDKRNIAISVHLSVMGMGYFIPTQSLLWGLQECIGFNFQQTPDSLFADGFLSVS